MSSLTPVRLSARYLGAAVWDALHERWKTRRGSRTGRGFHGRIVHRGRVFARGGFSLG